MHETLLSRAAGLMLLNTEPGRWIMSRRVGSFFAPERRMGTEDVHAHLKCDYWVGCRPVDGQSVDRVLFDLDATDDSVQARDEGYRVLRTVFGSEVVPLVWRTPSGVGLRVAYRIEPTPVHELSTGDETGLLPDALRAAGLVPGKGRCEVFPSPRRADRQPFGRDMPICDPDTLEVIPDAALGPRYSEAKLHAAVQFAESWYSRDNTGLFAKLGALPRLENPRGAAEAGPVPTLHMLNGRAPADVSALVKGGLSERSSRYRQEFAVGRAMWMWPYLFSELGLPSAPDRLDVARALARWLMAHANGMSQEWDKSVAKFGTSGALAYWEERYLKANNADGRAPVDRMYLSAAASRPELWPTIHLTPHEWKRLSLCGRTYGGLQGAERLRFEIWAGTLLRVAKRQMRRGDESGSVIDRTAQIASKWMAGWPGGRSYTDYLAILTRGGLMQVIQPHTRSLDPDYPGRARTYRYTPEWCRRCDLPMNPDEVHLRLSAARDAESRYTPDSAYHALWAVAAGIDLPAAYGRSAAGRIRKQMDLLLPRSKLSGF